jgi:hypothetical protein
MVGSASVFQNVVMALCRLAVVPFVLVSLIAPGVMVTQSDDGFEVVLCTGDGPITMVLDLDGAQDHGDENPCGWAVQVAATLHNNAYPPSMSIVAFDMDVVLPVGAVLGDQRPNSSIRVRGPPTRI